MSRADGQSVSKSVKKNLGKLSRGNVNLMWVYGVRQEVAEDTKPMTSLETGVEEWVIVRGVTNIEVGVTGVRRGTFTISVGVES